MKWNIIADSSCDMFDNQLQDDSVGFCTIPFYINVGNVEFVDDEHLDTGELVAAMELCKDASQTSCPSPYTWFEQFEKAENSIAVTISGNLSGSYNSAKVAQQMIAEKYPEKNVAIIDSCSAGPELILIIENIYQLIRAGMEFDDVVATTRRMQQHTHVTFALCSFHNLIKNGRMTKYAGLLAGKLGFWGIGIGTEEGTIQIKGKARGKKKAIAAIVDDIKERAGVAKTVLISHCHNRECAEMLAAAVREKWANAEVRIMPTRGLCSYYAELGGLIVGFRDNV